MNFLNYFLIFFSVSTLVESFELEGNFSFCSDLGEPVDIDFECERLDSSIIGTLLSFKCESLKSIFKIYSFYEDFYFRFEKSVYHSLNRSIFKTKCHQIQKIRIYKTIDSCIKDVLVSFVFDFQVIKGYLINDGIIKPHTQNISCSNSVKYVNYKNVSISKYKKEIDFKEIVKNSILNQSFDFNVKNYYEKFIEFKFEWRIFADFLLLLIVFLFIIINCIKSKSRILFLLRLFLR